MNQLQVASKFSVWALGFMFLSPLLQVLIVGVITVVCAAWKQKGMRSLFARSHHWSVFTHLLFFPAAIAVGVLLDAPILDDRPISPNRFGEISLEILLWASLASCAFWIWKMKGSRVLTAGVVTVLEVPVLAALFIAGMSVTGDWL